MPSTLWSGKPRAPFPWMKPTFKQINEETLLARFRTEAERQFEMREAYQKNVYIREKYFRLARKKKLYDDYRRRVFGKRIREEYAKALHAALRTSWHQMEAIEELKDMAAKEKFATQLSKENRTEWLTTQRELDNFDLKREEEMQVPETVKGKAGVKGVGKPPKGPLPKSPSETPKKLAAQKGRPIHVEKQLETLEMPNLVAMTQKVGEYVVAMKERKAKEIAAKWELLQIERKAKQDKEAEDVRLREEMARKMHEAQLWEAAHGAATLQRQEEERMAKQKEEEERERRRQESLALVEARNLEWTEATARDHEIYTMMREDAADEVYQQWLVWEAEKERKVKQREMIQTQTCTEIILQIVTMIEIRNDYKDEFNVDVPASIWRGWKTLFTSGHILPCPIWCDNLIRDHPWPDPNMAFAKEAIKQYLEEEQEWHGIFSIGKNKELGTILWEILGVIDTQPPSIFPPVDLSKFKLKLAILGAPYTGKTTISNKLEDDFEVVKIELGNVVSSALAVAATEEEQHKLTLKRLEAEVAKAAAEMAEREAKELENRLQDEALGLRQLVLPEKRKLEPPMVEDPSSPKKLKDNKSVKKENVAGKGKGKEDGKEKSMSKDTEKESDKQAKGKIKQKAEKDSTKLPNTVSKADANITGREETNKTAETEETKMATEPIPMPVPDPIIDLSYLTPKGRCGMEIKLARDKGLQDPVQALTRLIVITLADLENYDQDPKPFANKKDAVKKEKDAAQKEGAKNNQKAIIKPPLKGGKGGPKPTSPKNGKKEAASAQEEKQWGFVLDGFPRNVEELKALELQLSGIDADYVASHRAKASKIAPPPPLDVGLVSSTLDGYLLINVIDEKEALKRAMGKVIDPKTGRIYHIEYDPPSIKEKGLAQRLQPLENLDVVKQKIVTGEEEWNSLAQHAATFLNIFKIPQVQEESRYIVDTDEPINITTKFLDGWTKMQAAKGAAHAALEAETAAKKALDDTEKASKIANEVAEQYWATKQAEAETEKGLDALGGNPLAKKLVKEKITVTLTKKLDETCKAVHEAGEAAENARAFAMHAEQMAHEAQNKVKEADLDFAFHVREEAEAAAQSAKDAASRTELLLQKAEAASESAKAALNPPPEEEKPPADKKGKATSKKGEKELSTKDTTKEVAKKSKEAAGKDETKSVKKEGDMKDNLSVSKNEGSPEVVIPPVPVQPPPLEKDFAVALHNEWESLECKYLQDLECTFYVLHQERATTRDLVVEKLSDFVVHLQTEDDRQQIFNDFQEKYNRVEISDRRDKKIKPKLDQEVVKLEKAFNGLTDYRKKKCWELSEQSLISLLDSRVTSLNNSFTDLIQTELDRHLHTSNLLKKYFTKSLDHDILSSYSCKLKEVNSHVVASLSTPAWVVTLSTPLSSLYKAIMKTMQIAQDILTAVFGEEEEPANKKKKKGDKEIAPKKKKGEKTGSKADANKGTTKKSKNTPDMGVSVEELFETPAPSIEGGVPAAVSREHQVLMQRLQRIGRVALNYFHELQPIVDGAHRRMEEWANAKLNAEGEVLKEVLDLATHAVDENIPLWYEVVLNRERFEIDESHLKLDCPVTEVTNTDVWHLKFLDRLLTSFRDLACEGIKKLESGKNEKSSKKKKEKKKSKEKDSTKEGKMSKKAKKSSDSEESLVNTPTEILNNYVTVAAAKAVTDEAIEDIHTSFKEDLKQSLLPRLPATKNKPRGPFQDWEDISNEMFQEFMGDESQGTRFIDWRAFLISFVDAHYLYILSSSTRENLLSVREALVRVAVTNKAPEAAGWVSLEEFISITFWFDSDTPPEENDLAVSLKRFVFSVLSDGGQRVPWLKLLLYLSRDPEPNAALRKAFCAISGNISDHASLTPEEVLLLLYPGGIDAAWKAEVVPFVMEDIQNYLYWVAREKFERKEKAEESDLGGSEESDTAELEVDRDTSESTRSERGTVDDFITFSYKEFSDLDQAETVHDFLESLADAAPLDETDQAFPEDWPYKCDLHCIPTGPCRVYSDPDEFAIPTTYTVNDILRTEAMKPLRDMLYNIFSSSKIQSFQKTPIEEDKTEESDQVGAESKGNQKQSDSTDDSGSSVSSEKKKKKSN